jgi:hypothetical protein
MSIIFNECRHDRQMWGISLGFQGKSLGQQDRLDETALGPVLFPGSFSDKGGLCIEVRNSVLSKY